MQYQIGQVLATDTNSYNATIHRWKSKIIPAILAAAKEYQDLGIGDFDQVVLKEVLDGKLNTIETRYSKSYEKDVAGLKGKTLAARLISPVQVAAGFEAFRSAAANLISLFAGVSLSPYLKWEIHLDDCMISAGQPLINEEQIKRRFDLVIKNEDQRKFMELADALKKSHDAVRDFFDEKRPDMKYNYFVVGTFDQAHSSATMVGENQYLEIDPYFIEEFK